MMRGMKVFVVAGLVLLPAGLLAQTAAQSQAPAAQPMRMTVSQAEHIALQHNPNVTVAKLAAMASHEAWRENRSALLPSAYSELTAVDTNPGNRIAAGALNNPVIYPRAAYGAMVGQLITDFGRTNNVVASARFRAEAQGQTSIATANQIKLAVDREFYGALGAAAVLDVARQTVQARQLLADQVGALTQNKLKSTLDLSFAQTNLEQAKLILLDAENQYSNALASLAEILGYAEPQNFELIDDVPGIPPPAPDAAQLVSEAWAQRPELKAQDLQLQAARKLQSAAWEQALPSIRALGAVGQAPVRDTHIPSWYGAVGVNVEIPVFTGFRISAQTHEAQLQAEAENERLTGLRNLISRDVRTSWLAENTAFRRLSVTEALLKQARLGLDLAQSRYQLGLGSIVEVSQAQLAETEAEIASARARYDYLLAQAMIRFEIGAM
jgi:outer membrane protein